jgi:hypothetical protein
LIAWSIRGDAVVTSHVFARCVPRFLALGHADDVDAAIRYVATLRWRRLSAETLTRTSQ